MANLLFYDKPIALNKVEHKDTKIKIASGDFSFAGATNSVILAGVEFTEAAKEYPIVFAEAGDKIVPIALLGLRNQENLYIDENNNWDARYIPAFVRRCPFVLAETGEAGQRIVCIDESFPGFSNDEGDPLFENEEPTPLLKQAIEFLEEYQKQYIRTENFVNHLVENDLLVSLNAKVDMPGGDQFQLGGLKAVDEQKMLQLEDEKALGLYRSGELAWIYSHLISLGAMSSLMSRINRKIEAAAVQDAKAEEPTEEPADAKPAPKPKKTAAAKKKVSDK